MNRKIESERFDGIERAKKLIEISRSRKLNADEIAELKISHTGYGGIYGSCNQFFTPEVVTEFMKDIISIPRNSKILELSCGAGAFLNALYKGNRSIDVTGIELSQELSQIASICYPEANIICGNALDYVKQFENSVDVCIGNPPFGKASKNIPGFEIANGRLEEYFLEMAVKSLKKGGEAILILPDGVLANEKCKKIRMWLLDKCYYCGTISLPPETFYFSGTNCKTSIVYFKKKYKNCVPGDYPVFMDICENIGWNNKGRKNEKCDLPKIKEKYFKGVKQLQKNAFKCA